MEKGWKKGAKKIMLFKHYYPVIDVCELLLTPRCLGCRVDIQESKVKAYSKDQ